MGGEGGREGGKREGTNNNYRCVPKIAMIVMIYRTTGDNFRSVQLCHVQRTGNMSRGLRETRHLRLFGILQRRLRAGVRVRRPDVRQRVFSKTAGVQNDTRPEDHVPEPVRPRFVYDRAEDAQSSIEISTSYY